MRVLLIEDEQGICNFIRQGLEEEGFEVEVSLDGEEGLQMALRKSFDILLLDWMLPGKSGFEICREVRDAGINVPIIFLTARDRLQDTIAGLRVGANDYIKKPFHFEELLERIRVQLRHKETPLELELGVLRILPQKREVFLAGRLLELTRKEFDLLYFLAKNSDRVCSRQEIIKEVWDIHFEYDTGVIDVYINALRKKMAGLNYIRTVRGIGYRMQEQ